MKVGSFLRLNRKVDAKVGFSQVTENGVITKHYAGTYKVDSRLALGTRLVVWNKVSKKPKVHSAILKKLRKDYESLLGDGDYDLHYSINKDVEFVIHVLGGKLASVKPALGPNRKLI